MEPTKIAARFGEASSWAALAGALWGAVAFAPDFLAGGLGIDVAGWRVVCVIAALGATIYAIAKPECPECVKSPDPET